MFNVDWLMAGPIVSKIKVKVQYLTDTFIQSALQRHPTVAGN